MQEGCCLPLLDQPYRNLIHLFLMDMELIVGVAAKPSATGSYAPAPLLHVAAILSRSNFLTMAYVGQLITACMSQEHERKQGKKHGNMMQTVWAAVTEASNQEDPADAGSADAGAAKPQVAVITAAGQAVAAIDIAFAASSNVPAWVRL